MSGNNNGRRTTATAEGSATGSTFSSPRGSSGRSNWLQQQQQQQSGQQFRSGGSNNSDYYDTRQQQRSRKTTTAVPPRSVSRGYVIAVLENFGFIRSVDRMEDVFFHFTELVLEDNNDAAAGRIPIKVGDIVQFELKTSRDMKEKAARVHILPPDTLLQWDDAVDNEEGIVCQGFISKLPAGYSVKSNSTAEEFLQSCGTVQLKSEQTDSSKFGTESIYFTFDDYSNNSKKKTPSSSNTNNSTWRGNSGNTRVDNQLASKDLVEFRLFRNRRTKALFARDIILIQSEKDRLAAAKEEMLLKSSTSERGVVMALRQNGGYLRSTNHDVPIYFSYEHVILPHHESEECDTDYTLREGSLVQFLVVYEKVLAEDGGKANGTTTLREEKSALLNTVPVRLSARQVEELVPSIKNDDVKGDNSVKFYETLQCNVKGTIVSLPSFSPHVSVQNLPLKDVDLRGSYGKPGRIRLHHSIETSCCINGVKTATIVEFVDFYPEDAPGGYRLPSYMVGSSKEQQSSQEQDSLWICVGDSVLFDVICESFTYKSKPSNNVGAGCYNLNAVGWTRFRAHPPFLPEGKRSPTLLLENITLAGRFEGIVSTLKKEAGYGFIKLLDRNIDAYFRTSDIMPTELLPEGANAKLQGLLIVGAGVSFELSVSSTVQQEENLRCKRLIVLSVPDESASNAPLDISSNSWYFSHAYHCLRKDVQALVSKRHGNGGGILEICYGDKGDNVLAECDPRPQAQSPDAEKIYGMTPFERYPRVAVLLDALSGGSIPGNEIVFPWILPKIETAFIVNMAENYGATVYFVDVEGNTLGDGSVSAADWPGSGRICIQIESFKCDEKTQQVVIFSSDDRGDRNCLIPEADSHNNHTTVIVDPGLVQPIIKKPIKKGKASKAISFIRFDKSAIVASSGFKLQEGDYVVCDVHQCRPTGQFEGFNIRLLRKAKVECEAVNSIECVGFVSEIVAARQFGLISWVEIDKETNTSVAKEKLFFHLNDSSNTSSGNSKLRKGDEVKFLISNIKPKVTSGTGTKKIAVNIERLTPGTLPKLNITSLDRNLCQGYILIEPSHTKLNLSAPQKTSSLKSKVVEHAPNSGNRWQNVDLEKDISVDKGVKSSSNIEDGRILLLNYPAGQFCAGKQEPKDNDENNENRNGPLIDAHDVQLRTKETSNSSTVNPGVVAALRHVSYSKSAIVISAGPEARSGSESDTPRRGDLVVFSKSNKGAAKGIRVVQKNAAQLIRGHLTQINLLEGTAVFIEDSLSDESDSVKKLIFPLSEIVSCQPNMLKDMEKVEGIFHENNIYGVCRASDLYLVSAISQLGDKAQRPRLNLTVRKEMEGLGGKIIAQSSMAKGPDNISRGFVNGWTSRKSMFSAS